jgi:GTP-binding protein
MYRPDFRPNPERRTNLPDRSALLKITFIASVTEPHQYPEARIEVALAGRSNAGKSSLINAWASKPVAKVSKTPGKTVTLNFYDVGQHYRFVDMPGYGFSKRSGSEQMQWEKVVQTYLSSGRVHGVLIVLDCHREPEAEEKMLEKFLKDWGIPYVYVLTKTDRLNRAEMQDLVKRRAKKGVFLTSAVKREGLEEVEDYVFQNWIKK